MEDRPNLYIPAQLPAGDCAHFQKRQRRSSRGIVKRAPEYVTLRPRQIISCWRAMPGNGPLTPHGRGGLRLGRHNRAPHFLQMGCLLAAKRCRDTTVGACLPFYRFQVPPPQGGGWSVAVWGALYPSMGPQNMVSFRSPRWPTSRVGETVLCQQPDRK